MVALYQLLILVYHVIVKKTSADSSTAELQPLLEASKVVVAVAVQALATSAPDVGLAQLRMLVVLHDRGHSNLAGLAEAVGVSVSGASRTCDRLVNAGLVERDESAHDRRHLEVTLSATGRDLVERVFAERTRLLGAVVERMSPVSRERFLQALTDFNAASAELPDSATRAFVLG